MKRIQFLKTIALCAVFLGLLIIAISVIVCSKLYPDGAPDNRIVKRLMRNITIQSAAPDDQWLNKYPYETTNLAQITDRLNEWKDRIESFCTVSFPEAERINRYATALKKQVYHFRIDEIGNTHGNYSFVKDAAANAIAFTEKMKAEGYPLLYVQTPLKGSQQYYQGLPVDGNDLLYAERNLALCTLLEEGDVPLINVGKETQELFTYDVSNHWFPEDALKISQIIAERLNQEYGFSFDLTDFHSSNYQDCMEDYPQIREQILSNCGYTYVFPVPLQQHQYTLTHAEQEQWTGTFSQTIIRDPGQWNTSQIAYHNAYRIDNRQMYEVINHTAKTNPDKTILIIGDSYDWPICAYLAGGVGRLIIVNNATFTGSMLTYIRAQNPDVVIMAYNDAQFFEASSLEKAFHLE